MEWTRRQKALYRLHQNGEAQTSMTEERIKKLEEIGFSWNKYDQIWMQRYEELVLYHKHHGHTLVPTVYPANQMLANWVGDQRTQHRLSKKGEEWHFFNKVWLEWQCEYSYIFVLIRDAK